MQGSGRAGAWRHSTDERDGAIAGSTRWRVQVVFTADVFNEGSTSLPSTPCSSSGLPRARRSSFSSSARTAPREGQGGAHGPRLRRSPPQRVPIRPTLPSDDRQHSSRGSSATSSTASRSCRRGRRSCSTARVRELVLENIKQSGGQTLANHHLRAASPPHERLGTVPFGLRRGTFRRHPRRSLLGPTAPRSRAPVPRVAPREATLLNRVSALAHVDDPDRAAAYLEWLADNAPPYDGADPALQAFGRMLFFSLWPDGGGFVLLRRRAPRDVPRSHRRTALRRGLRGVVGLRASWAPGARRHPTVWGS